jgi:hypothetical protein
MPLAEPHEHRERSPVEAGQPRSVAFPEIADELDRIQLDFMKEH